MVWTTMRRSGRLGNKNRFSLTPKGNSDFSKAVGTDLKEEKGVKGRGKSFSPIPPIGWVQLLMESERKHPRQGRESSTEDTS